MTADDRRRRRPAGAGRRRSTPHDAATGCTPSSSNGPTATALLDVAYRTVDSPLGPLLLAATPAGLVRVAFEGEGHDDVLAHLAVDDQPAHPAQPGPPRRRGPPARRVLRPAGAARSSCPSTCSWPTGSAARCSTTCGRSRSGPPRATASSPWPPGTPGAVRAVGTACGHNPVPLVVPCHRVVRSDGTIGQYRGGVEAKRLLLDAGGVVSTAVAELDWDAVAAGLDDVGCAVAGAVLDAGECAALADLYDDDDRFRSTSTWPATASAGRVPLLRPAAARARRRSCGPRSTRTSCRSPGTGRTGSAGRRRGPTTSRRGSSAATPPARCARRRCCCATGPGTGTPCTATSTATSCSRCRSSSGSTSPATTTPAASSSSSSSGRGPSRGPRRRSSGRARRWCSRPTTAPCARAAGGRRPRCATA